VQQSLLDLFGSILKTRADRCGVCDSNRFEFSFKTTILPAINLALLFWCLLFNLSTVRAGNYFYDGFTADLLLQSGPVDFGVVTVDEVVTRTVLFTLFNDADTGIYSNGYYDANFGDPGQATDINVQGNGLFTVASSNCPDIDAFDSGTCDVEVILMAPSGAGLESGTLDVTYRSDGLPTVFTLPVPISVEVEAAAGIIEPATLTVTPTDLDFEEVVVNQSKSLPLSLRIENTSGNGSIPGSPATGLTLQLNNNAFSIDSTTCPDVGPGSSVFCNVNVTYTPTDVGPDTGALDLSFDDGDFALPGGNAKSSAKNTFQKTVVASNVVSLQGQGIVQPALSVNFDASDQATVFEGDTTANLFPVVAGNGAACDIDVTILNGTATNGTDFVSPASFTLSMTPGATVQTPAFQILFDDDGTEGNETFFVQFGPPSSGALACNISGGSPNVDVTIVDVPPPLEPAIVFFDVEQASVSEGGTVSFPITASNFGEACEINVSVLGGINGDAERGVDFDSPASFTVFLAPGETVQTPVISILTDDVSPENNEVFSLVLDPISNSGALSCFTTGENGEFVDVTIVDVPPVVLPSAELLPATLAVAEGGSTGSSLVISETTGAGSCNVDVMTVAIPGGASPVLDFEVISSRTINIAAGASTPVPAIFIPTDNTVEAVESFNVELAPSATNPCTLPGNTQTTVSINDATTVSVDFDSNIQVSVSEGDSISFPILHQQLAWLVMPKFLLLVAHQELQRTASISTHLKVLHCLLHRVQLRRLRSLKY